MNIMTRKELILIFLMVSAVCLQAYSGDKTKVLLVTGGHAYDTTEFLSAFRSMDNIRFDTAVQPNANRMIADKKAAGYDVLVFYDMWQEIGEKTKQAYLDWLKEGRGMVFLHHSLVSYQEWPEFTSIIGGKYVQPRYESDKSKHSGFKHGLDLEVQIIDRKHPVTKGLQDFSIHDEGYSNVLIQPDVSKLLQVEHPESSQYVGWTNSYANGRIVYIMLGHDQHAYASEYFRKLVANAVEWVRDTNF